jgi:(4-O-methyl)-D-glucuronate---lignin esterase
MRESKKATAAPRSLIRGISRRAFMASAGAAGLILRCDPLLAASGEDAAVQLGALEKAFQSPPDASKAWVYWWWLDGAASAAGITADLETMKAQGISGVLLFDAGLGGPDAPQGPLFMSEEWRVNFRHAVEEAARLGLDMSVNLCSGWNAGGPWVTRELAIKDLVFKETTVEGGAEIERDIPRFKPKPIAPPSAASRLEGGFPMVVEDPVDWYRDIVVLACKEKNVVWSVEQAVDVTRFMRGDRLHWNCPAGRWTILRIGYVVQPFTDEGYRRVQMSSWPTPQWEIDPMSAEAMDLHFAETAIKLIEDAGPLIGKTFKYTHIDSWEIGVPTWTNKFIPEFRERRGYDPTRYLPALAGKKLDKPELADRFTWDYRRTVADLIAENYYGRLRELSAKHGLGIHPESGGPYYDQFMDALQVLGISDVPMAEFWSSRGPVRGTDGAPRGTTQAVPGQFFHTSAKFMPEQFGASVRQSVSAAHIYGKPINQAEAFTNFNHDWSEDPNFLKPYGDRAFCMGLTRNVLCFFVQQSTLTDIPGYQWEHVGTHFDRNVTWWPKSSAWLAYLARCQHMLRQGLFVADILYYSGEAIPNFVLVDRKPVKGYDFDEISAHALLRRADAKNGRLVLPDGMSYRYLVIPEGTAEGMSPPVLDKIGALIEGGVTVVGQRPKRSLGLADYPSSQDEVTRLAASLWGADQGRNKIRQVGKGRVIQDTTLERVMAADGLPPDFELRGVTSEIEVDWIHRRTDRMDIYFVANLSAAAGQAEALFRISGKVPELWDPVTGDMRTLPEFREEEGRTVVPLEFAPNQSWFIVFQKPIGKPVMTGAKNFRRTLEASELTGPWEVAFDPRWGGPGKVMFPQLQDWITRAEEGVKYYSGTATYRKTFDAPDTPMTYLDLGAVKNLAQVRLNGEDLGIVWTAPWRVRLGKTLRARGNQLEIEVVNLWPNRLIGDGGRPKQDRLTKTNVRTYERNLPAGFPCWWNLDCEERKKSGAPATLLSSGLLGPVRLLSEV